MKFKGHSFRENKNLVVLPIFDEEKNTMPYVEGNQTSFIYFGKVIAKGNKKPLNAIKTAYKWQDTGEPVYATPLALKGHSLTNMAYGDKNQIYLAKDARCYQARINSI